MALPLVWLAAGAVWRFVGTVLLMAAIVMVLLDAVPRAELAHDNLRDPLSTARITFCVDAWVA